MKRKVCSFILVLVVLLLALSVSAFAYGETQTAEVPVSIKLEGPLPDPAETFTVQLTAVDPADAPMPAGAAGGVYEATITGAGSLTLKMDYEEMGVYKYSLKQLPGSLDYCTYDGTEYELTVTVYNDDQGTNEWQIATALRVKGEKEKLDEATFTNVYDPLEPAKLDPPLQKKVENKRGTAPADSVFTFAMEPSSADAPMPDPKESGTRVVDSKGTQYKDHKGPGEFEFGWMYYDQEHVGKTYTYTIKEVANSDKKFTYDSVIYTMTVVVGQKDGKVVLDVTYTNKSSGKAVDTFTFTNVYDNGGGGGGGTSPKTGDDTSWWPWALALILSGSALVTDTLLRRKKNRSARREG